MNDEKLKNQLGRNIATFRKRYGMTQAALAEKINFGCFFFKLLSHFVCIYRNYALNLHKYGLKHIPSKGKQTLTT